MPNDGAQATVDSNKVPWKEQVIGPYILISPDLQ